MEKNIQNCISQCKGSLFYGIFRFFIIWMCITPIMFFSVGWWSIPLGMATSLLLLLLVSDNSYYFTYQETTTDIKVNINTITPNTTKTKTRLSYITLEISTWVDKDDPRNFSGEDEFVCQVQQIDGRSGKGIELILPASQVFKKQKYFWKQTFKPIDKSECFS